MKEIDFNPTTTETGTIFKYKGDEMKIYRICEQCNKEYLLPLKEYRNGYVYNFGECPNCGKRDDVWIKVEYKDVAKLESINADLKQKLEGHKLIDSERIERLESINAELVEEKRMIQMALKMLMKAIPENVLPQIPDEVKLACLINLEEYEELSKKQSTKQ